VVVHRRGWLEQPGHRRRLQHCAGRRAHFTNIDADETVAGNQDFAFISTAAFTAPGQINWFSNGTDTFIQLNTDTDLAADGMIQLSGMVSGDSVLMFL